MRLIYARRGAETPQQLPQDLLDEVMEGLQGSPQKPEPKPEFRGMTGPMASDKSQPGDSNILPYSNVPRHITDLVNSLTKAARSGVLKPRDYSTQGGEKQ